MFATSKLAWWYPGRSDLRNARTWWSLPPSQCRNATVRQAQAQHPGIEIDLPVDVRREAQRVAEAPRAHVRVTRRAAARAEAGVVAGRVDPPFRSAERGRGLDRAHVDEDAVRVPQPQAVGGMLRGRVEQAHAAVLDAALQARQEIGARAEAQVVQLPAGRLEEHHLVLVAPVAAHDDAPPLLAGLQPELLVELAPDGRVRHCQRNMLQGTHGHWPPPPASGFLKI
jgi:hypothetical protein